MPKIRCPECESSMVYFRVRENAWICRQCGTTFSSQKKKENVDKKGGKA